MKNIFSLIAASLIALTPLSAYQNDCCSFECTSSGCDCLFNGFYIGGNVGVFSHIGRSNDLDGYLTDNSGWSTLDTTVAGGFQLGYDWQCENRVLGVAWDWTWTGAGKTLRDNPNVDDTNFIRNEHHWFTTIRGRAGLTVNNVLVYITAGPAIGRFYRKWADSPDLISSRHTRLGWIGGVGAEFAACGCWTVGGELYYTHFGDRQISGTASSIRYSFTHNDSNFGARVALNYRM